MKRSLKSLFILLLILVFSLPVLAQDAEATAVSTETAVVPDVAPNVPAAEDADGTWFFDLLTMLGQAFNSFPGGFFSMAAITVLLNKVNNSKYLAVIEKGYDYLKQSYPPETQDLLKERFGQLGNSLENLGKMLKEVTDGIPIESKGIVDKPAEVG